MARQEGRQGAQPAWVKLCGARERRQEAGGEVTKVGTVQLTLMMSRTRPGNLRYTGAPALSREAHTPDLHWLLNRRRTPCGS